MTVKVTSIGLKGLEGYRVQVEVRISTNTETCIVVQHIEEVVKHLEGQEHLSFQPPSSPPIINLSNSSDSHHKDFSHGKHGDGSCVPPNYYQV
ncbi:hypothetical protein [Metabacillus schmidteae]|uniref:hypothetical protein n=1 Tax=Metabacillus schmidteae TaxID=2730405 RepID=UPI001F3DCB5C|nr:hypothetical protein [Metabacillus schmidteae]